MSPLDFVTPAADPNLNFLIYGPPGSSKTTAAASAPGPILYLNADQPNATRFAHRLHGDKLREVHVGHDGALQTLIDATLALETGDYSTVVLDTVAETYLALLDELSGRRLSPHLDEYGDAQTHLERFIRKCCELPVNAIFVAHDVVTGENGEERSALMTTKSGSPTFAAKVMALVDVVAYCGVVTEDGDEVRYVAQLRDGKGRRGKARGGVLGVTEKLDPGEWIDRYRETEKEAIEAPKAAQKEKAAA